MILGHGYDAPLGVKFRSNEEISQYMLWTDWQPNEEIVIYSDDSLIRTRLFPVDISGLLNRPSVQEQKSVLGLFVRIIVARINESSLYIQNLVSEGIVKMIRQLKINFKSIYSHQMQQWQTQYM